MWHKSQLNTKVNSFYIYTVCVYGGCVSSSLCCPGVIGLKNVDP